MVAGEVKELARQTADAAGDVESRILEMQHQTTEVVHSIEEISGLNHEMSEINNSIALSVEEQSISANGVAETMGKAAHAVAEVSQAVDELDTQVNQEVALAATDAADAIAAAALGVRHLSDDNRNNAASAAELGAFIDDIGGLVLELQQEIRLFEVGEERFNIGKVKADHLAWKTRLEGTVLRDAIPDPNAVPDCLNSLSRNELPFLRLWKHFAGSGKT